MFCIFVVFVLAVVFVIAGQMTSVYVLETREEKRVCPFQKEGRSDESSGCFVSILCYVCICICICIA